MKVILTLALTIIFFSLQGQVNSEFTDPNNRKIQNAIVFYKRYLSEFNNDKIPDYSKYWSKEDCQKYKTPDALVYSVSSDYTTYNLVSKKTIFYARQNADLVHLKTLFAHVDSLKNVSVYAITNHYVKINELGNPINFISPFEINKDLYTTTQNQNITYHYPKYIKFNKVKSDSLLLKIRKFEKDWSFTPINFEYYFTKTQDELAAMRGLDYFLGMEDTTPYGMAFPTNQIIYSCGYGEGHFHEVLHLYLNPLYENSPINHGLIYYLGGSLGYDFDEEINKMNVYLAKYPGTNLGDFETIEIKDMTLNIYNIVTGLLSKIIYEKEGVKGVKRLLKYKDVKELFKVEFKIDKKDWDTFLKKNFKKYQK